MLTTISSAGHRCTTKPNHIFLSFYAASSRPSKSHQCHVVDAVTQVGFLDSVWIDQLRSAIDALKAHHKTHKCSR